jgi:mono/diheme cytochrome c family protein
MLRIINQAIISAGIISLLATAAYAEGKQVEQGRKLYVEYCASCHGMSGTGDGPVSRALTTPPANLQKLSERLGNPLPKDQVARYIDGRAEVRAHGPRDMPVWGARFFSETHGDELEVKRRIDALVAYLQSIQSTVRHASRLRPSHG